MSVMSAKATQAFPPVVPPQGFRTVQFGSLYRALDTIDGEHLSFIKRLHLGSCLVLTTKPLNEDFLSFLENEEIVVYSILSSNQPHDEDFLTLGAPFGTSTVGVSEDWMKRALELVFSLSRHPVLMVGSSSSCVDAALISCLRRIQRWGLSSVLAEFRQLTGRKIFDLEQFIEFFDASVVRIPHNRVTLYLDTFLRDESSNGRKRFSDIRDEILATETKVKKDKSKMDITDNRDESDARDEQQGHDRSSDSWSVEQHRQQLCISSLSQFDPSISLITDDITDD
mmetsp:Transcript_17977/g.30074  ORF Transcript_17977/g.30074 Transcript_17977/m.30074 type:complete len:283 (+) Transcript_17977:123-971(+)